MSVTLRALRPLAFTAIVFGVAAMVSPLRARAEQPPWSAITDSLFVILPHRPPAVRTNNDEGIWRFDPARRTWERVHPFYFNAEGGGIGQPLGYGSGSYLSVVGDRLLFESWPAFIELEPVTGRLVRRYSPLNDAAFAGAYVQGPVFSAGSTAPASLAPGVYGFLRCPTAGFGPCPSQLWNESLGWLLRRGGEPEHGALEQLADLRALVGDPVPGPLLVAHDERRQGLWLVRDTLSWLLPIRDGALDVAGATAHPLGLRLDALVRHPSSGLFYGRRLPDSPSTASFPADFVALDENLQVVETLGSWGPDAGHPKDRVPWTFAAFATDQPAEYLQTVPVVARTPGKNGSFWTSDLWLFNPSAEPTTVRIERVAAPAADGRVVDLPAQGTARLDDVLAWLGGGAGGDGVSHDALRLVSPYRWGEQVAAAARVHTPSSDPAERASGGTMGHAVPVVPGTVGYSNHLLQKAQPSSFVGEPAMLLLDDQPGRFRHNFGVVNSGDDPLALTLWWGIDPTLDCTASRVWPPEENSRVLSTPPHSVRVYSLEEVFPPAIREAFPARIAVTGERAAPVWLSMVDNVTNDATFVPYTLFSMYGDPSTTLAIPAIADLPGEHGSRWRTDLYLDFRSFELTGGAWPAYYPSSGGPPPPWQPPGVPAGARWWPWVVRDAVRRFLAEGGSRGAFEYNAAAWTDLFARTYTTRADGGTYGEMLPLYPAGGWPVQHFAGIEISAAFRVNLGLYNGDKAHSIVHRLTLYAADGAKVAEREVTLRPWENDVRRLEVWLGLQAGQIADGTYGLTVLPLDDSAHGFDGRSWAFISLIDNVTNDPTNWW